MADRKAGAGGAVGDGAGKAAADSIIEVIKGIVADTGAIVHKPGWSIAEAASSSTCALLTSHAATEARSS